MSADVNLGAFVLDKYSQVNILLDDLIRACVTENRVERVALLDGVKHQTNHHGLHMSETELAMLFLGRTTIKRGDGG